MPGDARQPGPTSVNKDYCFRHAPMYALQDLSRKEEERWYVVLDDRAAPFAAPPPAPTPEEGGAK